MKPIDIIAQGFGILGMILAIFSFQNKGNKGFFILQALSGLSFAVNFFLIGALAAALLNCGNLVRGVLYARYKKKKWVLVLVLCIFALCTAYSIIFHFWGDWMQVLFAILPFTALTASSISMYTGNGKYIRYVQLFYTSPVWLVHNFYNFSLGGILCEVFSICSVLVSFWRFGKDGFEK